MPSNAATRLRAYPDRASHPCFGREHGRNKGEFKSLGFAMTNRRRSRTRPVSSNARRRCGSDPRDRDDGVRARAIAGRNGGPMGPPDWPRDLGGEPCGRAVRRAPAVGSSASAPWTAMAMAAGLAPCSGGSVVRPHPRLRRQRQRPGIVSAGEFHQRLDPGIHRRVGREQVGKALARVVDAQFHHRRGRAGKLAAVLDLAQRRDHGVGILGQFDRSGVGEQFARSRQRQLAPPATTARPARSARPR